MSPHSSGQAPFTILVTELQKAARSQGFISINSSTFKLLKDAAQPLEDSSVPDAVELLETANNQACLRLEPTSVSCIVWAAFHLKPSLLQQRLLHVLSSSYLVLKDETKAIVYFDNLMGAGKVDMSALRSRRKGILQPLVKILFALLHDASRGGLRVNAAEFLFAIVHADIDAKRVVFDGAEKWRRLLGSIVHNSTGDYVLRVVAANLIRELLIGRFDRHRFWPSTVPSASFLGFPLARAADSQWLFEFATYVSDLDVNRAFHGNELPEVVRAQGLEVDSVTMTGTPLLAILSSAITFVWPSESQTCLHRLEVPMVDAMEVQQEEHHICVHYRSSSGYKISEGVKSELRHLRLRVEDAAQALHDSILIADKLSPSMKEKIKIGGTSSQRSAHALVDLSHSSPSTASSVDETNAGVGEIREVNATSRIGQQRLNSDILPSARQSKAVGKNDGIEAQLPSENDKTNLIDIASQALTASARKAYYVPRSNPTSNEDHPAVSKHKSTAVPKSTAMAPQDNTQARKRQNEEMKSKTQSESGIDWDEGLRAEAADSDNPAQKKAKTKSKPVRKSAAATSNKPKKDTNKMAEAARETKSKTVPTSQVGAKSSSTVATTRARRSKANKPIHYVEDSDSDEDAVEQKDSVLLRDSGPRQASKQDAPAARSGKNKQPEDMLKVGDSQNRGQAPVASSHASEALDNVIDELSDSMPPSGRQTEQQPQPEESADDSHPLDNAKHTQLLQENDRSFGSTLKDALGLPDTETVPANKPATERAFGNSENFLQDVNANKSSSPQKVTAQQRSRAQRTDNTASPRQPNRPLTASRMQQQAQPAQAMVATKPRRSEHAQIKQKQSAVQRPTKPEESRASSRDLESMNRSESAEEEGVLANNAGSAAVPPTSPGLHKTPAAIASLTRETVAPAVAHETTMEAVHRDKPDEQANRPSTRKVAFTEVKATTRNLVEDEKEIVRRRSSGTAHPKTAAKTRQSGASVEQSSVGPSAPVLAREQPSEHEKTRTPRNDTTASGQLTSENAPVAWDESSMMTDERMQRKTQLVSFGAKGPKNQGTFPSNKSTSTHKAAEVIPSETRKHHDFKKQPAGRPSPVPLKLSVPSDATRQQVQSMEISDESDGDDGIVGQEEETVAAIRGTAIGRNASQGSIVDRNGSPRLHAPHEPRRPLPPIHESSPELVEEAESSVDASEEQEESEYTESSPLKSKAVAPIAVSEKTAPKKLVQPKQAKMIQARPSIGLNEQLIQKFPQAKHSIVTKVFKTQMEPAIGRGPALIEKPNDIAIEPTLVREEPVAKMQQTIVTRLPPKTPVATEKPNEIGIEPLTVHGEPVAKVQQAIVTRLPPKTPVEEPRPVIRSSSKTPASFNTRMQERMMPPPPVPEKHEQDAGHIHAQGSKGKAARQSGVMQDADQTLIGVEDSDEAQEQRASPLRRRQPSPDSSSSSDSEYNDPRGDANEKGLFKGDDGSMWKVPPRPTQQAMRALLSECVNRVVFRMAKAEGAVSVNVHKYLVGSLNIINVFQGTYETTIDHHVKKGNTRVGELCERYRSTIEQAADGAVRMHQGSSMDELEAAIDKQQTGVIGMIQEATNVNNGAQQEEVE